MTDDLITLSADVAAGAALLRLAWILVGKLRQAWYSRRAVSVPKTWRDLCTVPEPFVMAALAWALWRGFAPEGDAGAWDLACGAAAMLSALLGLALSFWAFASFPSVSTGHYVLPDHRVVTRGAYGFVRHPIYVGAFLIWLGLLFAFRSPWVAAVLALYAVPSYLVYIRAEEEMLVRHLGDEYVRYRDAVGRFLPRLRSRRAPPPGR